MPKVRAVVGSPNERSTGWILQSTDRADLFEPDPEQYRIRRVGNCLRDERWRAAGDCVIPAGAYQSPVHAAASRPRRGRAADEEHAAVRGNRRPRSGGTTIEGGEEAHRHAVSHRLFEVLREAGAGFLPVVLWCLKRIQGELAGLAELLERRDAHDFDVAWSIWLTCQGQGVN